MHLPALQRELYGDRTLTRQLLQPSQGDQVDPKRTRRSRLSPEPNNKGLKGGPLPSPVTHKESTTSEDYKEGTITPPPNNGRSSQAVGSQAFRGQRNPNGLSSPPSDTQPFTQFSYPPEPRTYAVDDEEAEGVWGYLVPMDDVSGEVLVLRRREACPVPQSMTANASGKDTVPTEKFRRQEEEYEKEKQEKGVPAGGYLIGRHRECGKLVKKVQKMRTTRD